MQRIRRIIIGILCLVPILILGDVHSSLLLTEADYEIESQQEEPALSSSLASKEEWESYNEWHCYPIAAVELTCIEIDYGSRRRTPTIVATSNTEHYEYDLDPTFNWDCEFTLKEWRGLLNNSSQVCFFGAYLQSLGEKESLWVLSQIKSENGYWKEYESEAYRYARRKHEDFESEGQEGSEM